MRSPPSDLKKEYTEKKILVVCPTVRRREIRSSGSVSRPCRFSSSLAAGLVYTNRDWSHWLKRFQNKQTRDFFFFFFFEREEKTALKTRNRENIQDPAFFFSFFASSCLFFRVFKLLGREKRKEVGPRGTSWAAFNADASSSDCASLNLCPPR